MKIITANIPWIIVGIARWWILKIVKLLLFVSALPFVTRLLTGCTCVQCRRKSVWTGAQTDNGDIISTLGDNCLLIGGHSICPPCPLPLECHQRCLESDQDILSWCLMRVTSDHTGSVTAHWLHKHSPNEHMMVTRSDQARAPCQM